MGPLFSLFPRLFRVVSNKESSVKDCLVGRVKSTLFKGALKESFMSIRRVSSTSR